MRYELIRELAHQVFKIVPRFIIIAAAFWFFAHFILLCASLFFHLFTS